MHNNAYNLALYSSALLTKLFNSNRKLQIISVKLNPSLLLNALVCICSLTFINKTLHFLLLLVTWVAKTHPSEASTMSTLSSLPEIHDMLCN